MKSIKDQEANQKSLVREDRDLIKMLEKEAATNDHKILVYPYEKRAWDMGKIIFKKKWHVMKEGNKTDKSFENKEAAVSFANKLSSGNQGRVFISAT